MGGGERTCSWFLVMINYFQLNTENHGNHETRSSTVSYTCIRSASVFLVMGSDSSNRIGCFVDNSSFCWAQTLISHKPEGAHESKPILLLPVQQSLHLRRIVLKQLEQNCIPHRQPIDSILVHWFTSSPLSNVNQPKHSSILPKTHNWSIPTRVRRRERERVVPVAFLLEKNT